MSLPNLTFHGCFGTLKGYASEPIAFLSDEWTQVRNKACIKKRRKNSTLRSDQNFVQNAGGIANLEVALKVESKFAYLNSKKDSRKFKKELETNLIKKMHAKKF